MEAGKTERVYQMTRVRAGSYLLPSNDGQTLWHIHSFVDGKSYGLENEPDRTWWSCSRFPGTIEQGIEAVARDMDDYGYIHYETFREKDTYLRTRAAAIEAALR